MSKKKSSKSKKKDSVEEVKSTSESTESSQGGIGSMLFNPFARGNGDNVQIHIVDISVRSVLLIVGTAGILYLGFKLREVILIIFLGFIISSASLPLIRVLQGELKNKALAIGVVYLSTALLISTVIALIVVPLMVQLRDLADSLPEYITDAVVQINSNLGTRINADEVVISITGNEQTASILEKLPQNINNLNSLFTALSSFGDVVALAILSIILSIYIVADRDTFIDLLLLRIVNEDRKKLVKSQIAEVEKKLGMWLRGQALVCTIVGIMAFILLATLQVPFALPLAVFTGLMVAVPTIGPFISGIPIVVLTLVANGIPSALLVLVGYLIIQQTENSVLVPRIMGNVVGVKPIVVFVGVIVGLALGGIKGAFITVPILVILKISYDSFVGLREISKQK